MNNIHLENLSKKADKKISNGILKITLGVIVLVGLMSVHAPLLVVALASPIIVPSLFKGICDFKQGYQLRSQVTSSVEPIIDVVEVENSNKEKTTTPYFTQELYVKEQEKSYQKVKRR